MKRSCLHLLLLTGILCFCQLGAQTYPLRTIEEIQFVSDPATSDVSPFLGDTVTVRGLLMNDVRSLSVGERWASFVVDPESPSDPWNGFFVIQHDTTVTGTFFTTLLPGDVAHFTGVIEEFSGLTQLALLTDPIVPVVLESFDNPLPAPVELSSEDLTNLANGEQWEGQFVRLSNVTIRDNQFSGNRALVADSSNWLAFLDDYFRFYRERFDNGTFSWPANGSVVHATGFVRGFPSTVSLNPRDFGDLTVLSSPPVINSVDRNPEIPASLDDVTVSANITDTGIVTAASLHYSVNAGPWLVAPMSGSGDLWSGDIPSQGDGSALRYFVSATDNDGNTTRFPEDTSRATGEMFRYFVRDNGLLIRDVQDDGGYRRGNSAYLGIRVWLRGVVMSAPNQFTGYFIQDADAPWSGLFVSDIATVLEIGDLIDVHGMIVEDFGFTRMDGDSVVLVQNNTGPFPPVVLNTGDINTGASQSEAYESVLVRLENVTVTDTMPDSPNNFGEFIIDDGSGGLRVDDLSEQYEGNLGSEVILGSVGALQGFLIYQFSDFKVAPRDNNDVDLMVLGIDNPAGPIKDFVLHQNYPNPFNPETRIRFYLKDGQQARLEVFDVLGQRVASLLDGPESQPAGWREVSWNGRNFAGQPVASGVYLYRLQAGGQVLVRKMMLMR